MTDFVSRYFEFDFRVKIFTRTEIDDESHLKFYGRQSVNILYFIFDF